MPGAGWGSFPGRGADHVLRWRRALVVLLGVVGMLAVAAELQGTERPAASGVLAVVLFVSSVAAGLRWVPPLPLAAWFAANLYVLHHGRLAWDWQVDPAVLGLAVLVAGLGAMAGEVHVVRWTVREMRAARTRWQLRRDPDRCPSPRPFNHDERLWERELTRS